MDRIFKYELSLDQTLTELTLPKHFDVLGAAMQDEKLVIWAIINESFPLVKASFGVVATGQSYNFKDADFVNTVYIGRLVYHVFQIRADYGRD